MKYPLVCRIVSSRPLIFLAAALLSISGLSGQVTNIGPMSWTAGRSDWINVKTDSLLTPKAVGNGTTDDTAALQAALDMAAAPGSVRRTVYLPAGTYKVTGTLYWQSPARMPLDLPNYAGVQLIGDGSNTTIQWAGAAGGTILMDAGSTQARYMGLVWNAGPSTQAAAFAVVHDSQYAYQGKMVHENEAFIGFVGTGATTASGKGGTGIIYSPRVNYVATEDKTAAVVPPGSTQIPLTAIPAGLVVGAGVTGYGIPRAADGLTTTTITAINTTTKVITISAATIANQGLNNVLKFCSSSAGAPEASPVPAGAIVSGSPSRSTNAVMAESMIWNCLFKNCTNGVVVTYTQGNNYMWSMKGCEFQSCDIGVNPCGGAANGIALILDTHFQGSTTADIHGGNITTRIRRCTSKGSYMFYTGGYGGTATRTNIQDCWVDAWTGPSGSPYFGSAIYTSDTTDMIFDCNFTNPPTGAQAAIVTWPPGSMDVTLSQNYISKPTVPLFVDRGGINVPTNIPPGGLAPSIVSPDQTFLNTAAFTDSATILDVTKPPFNAVPGTDCTAAIQSAIDTARTNNNNSIVYLPCSVSVAYYTTKYLISSSLNVTGSNYTIQGSGYQTQLIWNPFNGGTTTTPFVTVTSPNNIKMERMFFWMDYSGGTSSQPVIKQTATTGGTMTYDNLVSQGATNTPGLVLDSLPTGSTVLIPRNFMNFTVKDCGQATILVGFQDNNGVKISGTTRAKTGFLGVLIEEGLQRTSTSGYDLIVDDNQDLVICDYYTEQSVGNHLLAANTGGATWSGRLTIQGIKENSHKVGGGQIQVNINNYKGNFFYGSQVFQEDWNPSVVLTASGTDPCNFTLLGTRFWYAPTFTNIGAAYPCKYIGIDNSIQLPSVSFIADTLPTGWQSVVIGALDHIRQAGAYDLAYNHNLVQRITNTSAELDAANPTPTTTLGYTPAAWTVTNAAAAGSGVRNCTVVTTASPFGAGAQGLLWLDTTATFSGSRPTCSQTTATSALVAGQNDVWTFDFRLNSSANHSDIWLTGNAGAFKAGALHLSWNGTSGYFGGNVGGSDHAVTFSPALTLAANTWYRARIVVPMGGGNATLYVTPWTASGPGTTSVATIDGLNGTATTGINKINISSGSDPGYQQSVNLDNLTITNNPVARLY